MRICQDIMIHLLDKMSIMMFWALYRIPLLFKWETSDMVLTLRTVFSVGNGLMGTTWFRSIDITVYYLDIIWNYHLMTTFWWFLGTGKMTVTSCRWSFHGRNIIIQCVNILIACHIAKKLDENVISLNTNSCVSTWRYFH